MKVICIDDSYRPECIPASVWIKKGQEYTILRVSRAKLGDSIIIELVESDLTPYAPYKGYRHSRLTLPKTDLNKETEDIVNKLEEEFKNDLVCS